MSPQEFAPRILCIGIPVRDLLFRVQGAFTLAVAEGPGPAGGTAIRLSRGSAEMHPLWWRLGGPATH